MSTALIESVKVVVVGDGSVGKTCLLYKYTQNSFYGEYVPTIFDNHNITVIPEGEDAPVSLVLWDTAGQEAYDDLRKVSYPGAQCFLVVFSVVSPTSYENVRSSWVPELMSEAPGVPIVLVGTKVDLRDNPEWITKLEEEGKKLLTQQDGLNLAQEVGAKAYVESSALQGTGIKAVFDEATKQALIKKRETDGPVKRKKKKKGCAIA